MALVPDARSLSKAQSSLRPPEADPEWSQTAIVEAPLLPPDELVWLCPMLSLDYTAGCHYNDYGTDDCYAVDPADPTYPGHTGIDFINSGGKNVYPVAAGTVVAVCTVDDGEFGTWVWVRHLDETHTRIIDSIYGHVTPEAGIVAGVAVTENTLIAKVYNGIVGSSFGAHLHLSIVVHDVANADNGWEILELAGYGTDVYTWYTGHAVDPLKFIFCSKFCCGEDDIAIAEAPPPPAQEPPLPPLPRPRWRPHPYFPADGGYNSGLHKYVEGGSGGWPPWDATIETWPSITSMNVYPFFDGPAGYATVLLAELYPGVGWSFKAEVWLLHSDLNSGQMITTWYGLGWWGTDTVTLDVQAGDRVMAGTRLGRIVTAAGGRAFLEWTILVRETGEVPFDKDETDPYVAYSDASVHPACYLGRLNSSETYWFDWPVADYPAAACFEPGYAEP